MSVPAAFLRGKIERHCSQIIAVAKKIPAGLAPLRPILMVWKGFLVSHQWYVQIGMKLTYFKNSPSIFIEELKINYLNLKFFTCNYIRSGKTIGLQA